MTQLIKNAARAALTAAVAAADTSLTVDITKADLFPAADTGTDPVNTVGKDWFKVVLEDVNHNIEIVYVRTRTLGSATMSNLLRGQEGTTAISFASGSICGLRMTSLDMQAAIDLAAQATAQGKLVLNAATPEAQAQAMGTGLQKQSATAVTADGTATAYTITPTPAVTAYAADIAFDVTFPLASGNNPTLQISGLASPPNLVKQGSDGSYSNISSGDFTANHRSRVRLLSATQALVENLPVVGAKRIQTLSSTACTTTGTAPAFVATQAPATSGAKIVHATMHAANAGVAATLAVNGDAAKSVKQYTSAGAKTNPTWLDSQLCAFMDDGTDWILLNPLPPSETSIPPDRQTVLSGPVDSSGFASFGGSTGSATLTLSGTIKATAAAGPDTDYTGSITNPAFTSPGGAGTAYLHLAITSAGVVTAVTRVYKPIYIFGTGYSTTNAQWSFSRQQMTGKLGNGATADQVYEVCIGHCTYSAGAWTGTPVYYAIKGRYFSQTATGTVPTTTRISASHKLGSNPDFIRCTMVCITNDGEYVAGNEMEVECMTDASNNNVVTFGNDDEYTMGVGASSGATYIWNKTANTLFAFTAGSWAVRFYADRGRW